MGEPALAAAPVEGREFTPRAPTMRDLVKVLGNMDTDNVIIGSSDMVPPQVLACCFEDCTEDMLWELTEKEYTALTAKARATSRDFLTRWDTRAALLFKDRLLTPEP